MYKDNNKYKGGILSSSDVSYQGRDLTFIDETNCNFNLNEVIDRIDLALAKLVQENDFTHLDKKSLSFDPLIASNKDILQVLINSVDTNTTTISEIEEELNDLDIGGKEIAIDLGCLTPDAAGCAIGQNKYTLLSILALFKNEICLLKNN